MKLSFDRIESRLQNLIEGSVARLFPLDRDRQQLTQRLIQAMLSQVHPQESGASWAPNHYVVVLHPTQAQRLLEHPELIQEMAKALQTAGNEAGLIFPSQPKIEVEADSQIGVQEVSVVAQYHVREVIDTATLETSSDERAHSEIPRDAFLIVDGEEIFPLKQAVINVGRSSQNELVVNDLRVSRTHAQLRAMKGRFAIFDLDSTGGTFVNGQRITQTLLYPGDVISIAGVPLVYGQDSPVSSGETQEM
jgi:hypothetical protein